MRSPRKAGREGGNANEEGRKALKAGREGRRTRKEGRKEGSKGEMKDLEFAVSPSEIVALTNDST